MGNPNNELDCPWFYVCPHMSAHMLSVRTWETLHVVSLNLWLSLHPTILHTGAYYYVTFGLYGIHAYPNFQ